jgi:cation diffusion facilitator CzcD-associated flavoprotein CzcO
MNIINKYNHIAIVGAGISGLSLAINLTLHGFKNISIFEKDSSF